MNHLTPNEQAMRARCAAATRENERLRATISRIAKHVGASAAPTCSVDFLECVSEEVRLVTGKLRAELAEAREMAHGVELAIRQGVPSEAVGLSRAFLAKHKEPNDA